MQDNRVAIAGVRLTRNRSVVYVDSAGFSVEPGDAVTVLMDGDAGLREANVVIAPQQFVQRPSVQPAGRVVDVTGRERALAL